MICDVPRSAAVVREVKFADQRALASRPSGEWSDDDFDVLADGVVVGRIMKITAAVPDDAPWV